MNARRGRPPAYDRDAALLAIAETFRMRGYAGASLDEIARAAGMNRPSLFAAFGNKKSMFLAAVEDYRRRMRVAVSPALESDGALSEVLVRFFDAVIAFYHEGIAPGCLVLCTAPAEAPADKEISAVLADALKEIEKDLKGRILRAAVEGQDVKDVAGLAQLMSATLASIAIQARAGVMRADLEHFARATVAVATGTG
ncbi:TetR/AcrR family transcriptional regulator [Nitratireductor kimnyeongensis]|uniref:TetR/AcrR family transcriptional regulator n=1 Tax=Nitratireductor kimnyeongensis TaxID=430679 RepID=A0ABW0T9I3_9HYPH|nr:TetR/AcrR family transcriptional regulator [Nitratireductor kimnyeongensis]QZZ36278.1 TetR/AcrR family transcriptional regulator [Nitratireductor kimnyeongensis]